MTSADPDEQWWREQVLDFFGLRGLSVDELKRQVRCVKLHGEGILYEHGGQQISLDPTKVTLTRPADAPATEAELRSRITVLEERMRSTYQLAKQVTRYDDESRMDLAMDVMHALYGSWEENPEMVLVSGVGAERP